MNDEKVKEERSVADALLAGHKGTPEEWSGIYEVVNEGVLRDGSANSTRAIGIVGGQGRRRHVSDRRSHSALIRMGVRDAQP